jgi:photosystem II stability/assembly factor-like uncharacterized protein
MKKTTLLSFLICLLSFYTIGQTETTSNDQLLQSFKLRNIGPALMSGRIADIVKNPQNPSTWYVATASSGVWKTTNNATTWTPVFDHYGSFSTGAIAIDHQNPNVLWLGTGENASQRSAGYGDGIYKSVNSGKSWQHMGLKNSEHIARILIHPDDSDIVYVASQGPLWAPGGDRGLFKTTDGGKNWENVLSISENTGITDVVMDPRDPDVLYAASYQRRRHVGILVAGGPESAIFKSTDGGQNWKKLSRGLPGGNLGRIALAISPQQPDVIYTLIAAEENKSGFFRSSDQGESWTKMSDYIVVDPQYYGEIYADPHQFDKVYAVDVLIHYTEDGGKSFQRQNTRNKHVDNHAILFDPNDPDYLMVGCDGGIYESWDRGESWKFVDNLPITQFYRVGLDNDLPFYNVYGGTQDNATQGGPSRTNRIQGIQNSDWFTTVGGDGFQTRVDPRDPNILYSMSQYAGIVRYDKKSGERLDIKPQSKPGEEALRWHWDAPLIISPHNPDRLYYAAQKLFISEDRGYSWKAISGDLSRNLDRNQMEVMGRIWPPEAVWKNVFTSPFGTIVSLSESKLKEGLIAVGTADGLIQITEDGGQSWKKIDRFPGIPDMTYVSDVLFSQHEQNTLYATFNNHKNGDFKPYVLKSTDLGKTWTALHQTVPERQVTWSIVEDHVDKNLLFLATELGLFCTLDGGQNWIQLKNGVPTIAFRDLEIQKRENDLVAASFGRGFFILDDYSPLREINQDNMAREGYLFSIRDALHYVQASQLGGPKGSQGDAYYTAPNPPYGAVFTFYLKESLSSLKQERKQQEQALLEEGKSIDFPSWEQLKQEDFEIKDRLFITIRDDQGEMVRRMEVDAGAGIHRVAWDFSLPEVSSSETGRVGRGPMALPGNYTSSLEKIEKGQITTLSTQPFKIKSLNLATIQSANKEMDLQFYRNAMQLQKDLTDTQNDLQEKVEKLDKAYTLLVHLGEQSELLTQVFNLQMKLKEHLLTLQGDQIRAERAEFVPPGLLDRARRATRADWNSSGPTQTHKDSYSIALSGYNELKTDLDALLKNDWNSIEKGMIQLGIW